MAASTVASIPASPPRPGLSPAARVMRVVVLVGADCVTLIGAWVLAYLIWARPVHGQPAILYVELTPLVALFIFGYAQAGLYPGIGLGPVETLRRVSYVTFFAFLLLASVSFAIQLPHVYSRLTVGLAYLFSVVGVPLARFGLTYQGGKRGWWSEPVVVVGTGERARRAIERLADAPLTGYRPVGVLALAEPDAAAGEVSGVPVLGTVERAGEVAARGVAVALLEAEEAAGRSDLDRLHQHFRHVVMVRGFDDLPVEGVAIRNLGGLLGVEYTNNLLMRHNRVVKRVTDVVLGGVALLFALPVMAVAALAVKLASPGPALFRQERAGLDGQPIRVTKIRTMHPDAQERLEAVLGPDPELRAEWEARHKLRRDPRLIGGVGPLLRRLSIDELPQLWAVVRGRMSLVGPRPLPAYHLERFPGSFRQLRQRVRPGLTGMWQVSVRADGDPSDHMAFDTYYIRNWSLWLDLYILGRTVSAVVTGRGAY